MHPEPATARAHGGRAMRVCLVAYHFPPDPAVGSLRALKVARAFRDAGHSVHVISVQSASLTSDGSEPGIHVQRVRPTRMARELYAAVKARWRAKSTTPAADEVHEVEGWRPPTKMAFWRRFLFSLIWLPDDRQGFIAPAYRAIRALGLSSADLVYSTCPPYSPHLAALLAKWRGEAKWALEFRDPWIENDQKPWWIRSRLADAIDAKLEDLCLRSADYIVSVSEGISRGILRRSAAVVRDKSIVVRNGIEVLTPLRDVTTPPSGAGPKRILHLGTFSHGRDPRPFLRGLSAIAARNALGSEAIQVDFVGQCRWFGEVSLERYVEELGIAPLVYFQDWVTRDRAGELLASADALLLLAQHQPKQVPNKLYEYLGTRKPIIAFADADGESASMLEQVGGHYVIADDSDAASESALEAVLSEQGRRVVSAKHDNGLLQEWTTERQMRRLMDVLGAHA